MDKPTHTFSRTVCACAQCVGCCKRQPGPLAPGDYERIQQHTKATDAEMQARFVASPGALVKDRSTGRVQRIGTVTPRFDRRRKRCVFLDDHDRCTIHAVAPFGCAYFDTHMSLGKGHVRSLWLARETARPEYQALRNTLPYTDTYKPSRYK